MDEKLRQTIMDHLMSRPIASIVVNSMEKDFDIALKMMCVIDFFVEKRDLYAEIKATPKLLDQLLRFRFFGSFKFREYQLKKSSLGNKLLQCESCEFTAPYITTLEHMVMSHDLHKSALICQYCQTTRLREHDENHTLDNCYLNYQIRQQINTNHPCPPVIVEFYKLIRKIAAKLGVNVKRNDHFNACGNTRIPIEIIEIDDNDDDDDEECKRVNNEPFIHNRSYNTKKTIKLDVLDELFQEAMYFFNVSIEGFVPINATNVLSSDTIQTVQTIPSIPGHITASAYYSDNSSTGSSSPYSFYPSPAMPAPMQQKIQPEISMGRSQRLVPGTVPSISTYSPPYTPPIYMNDNLSTPIHTSAMSVRSTNGMNIMHNMNGTNFSTFISSMLNNMSSESAKRDAEFKIKKFALELLAEDMKLQMENQYQ